MFRIQSPAVTLVFLLTITALFQIRAEERKASQEGVEVTVSRIEDSLKGFRAFKIGARNTTQEPRSVHLEIYLNNSHRKELPGAAGKCTVFIALQPGDSKDEEKQCKEIESSDSWSFRIKKVFKFILK